MRWGKFSFSSSTKKTGLPRGRRRFRSARIKRIQRPFLKRIILLLGVTLFAFGFYNLCRTFFIIKTIRIAGEPEQAIKNVESLGGQNLFFLNQGRWEEKLKRENPTLREIKIKKEFPSQVLISFQKRKPQVIIFDPGSENSFLIDEEGVILEKSLEEERLPMIIASLQNFKIGDRIKDKSIGLALELIPILEGSAESSRFEIDKDLKILKITLAKKVEIFISLEKEKDVTVFALQTLAKKFKIEGNWPAKIDLRFEKPVLTF